MEVLIIANTLLSRAFNENIPITPMKLQKLIYLVYRQYLQTTGVSLFPERFEAWQYGPVLSTVYSQFKKYCAKPINEYYVNENGSALIYNLNTETVFSQVFNSVWGKYKDDGAITLSKKTHQPDSAWDKANKREDIFLLDEDIRNERWE